LSGVVPGYGAWFDEIVSKELVKKIKVSSPLDLVGVSANDDFSCF
jgi:hypothetical protein